MKYLLDTHAFAWFDIGDDQLSPTARDLIDNPDNEIFLSLASVWEMQIKVQLGKLTLRQALDSIIQDQQRRNHLQILSITLQHIYELNKLPALHRDPFDRLLIAQARAEQMPLITRDPNIAAYPVQAVW